jgi:hypothetical protein
MLRLVDINVSCCFEIGDPNNILKEHRALGVGMGMCYPDQPLDFAVGGILVNNLAFVSMLPPHLSH